jgi:acyl-[acyl-carrier-protein]-phospholipid O-acyltransferase / long-chain-fatty-acid--[acyl-carrier-protein] ligase
VTLIEQFIRTAKRYPNKVAIVDRATGHRVTYKAALVRTLILARRFRSFDPGFIGVMIPTSAGAILTVVAAVMSGRIPVMINYSTGAAQNCQMAQRRLAFRTVITSRALLSRLKIPEVPGMVFIEDLAAGLSTASKIAGLIRSSQTADRLCRALPLGSADDNAVILFTSGSELDPKAVPLTHRNISSNIEGMHGVLEYGLPDTILGNLPLFHVFGLNTNLWLPLVNGMTVVTYPNPLDFRAICAAIREERVTMVVGTPTFLSGYLQRSEPGDFATVRLLITGADKCPEPLRQGFWEQHRIPILEGYGTTETSPVVSVNTPDRNRPGSVGRPLPNLSLRFEHWETGAPCGPNEVGKIFVQGPSVTPGYFDDFEATATRLRHGWYDTGDMGYVDEDGYLWLAGRLARFLKIGGEMVSLVQVEAALQRAVPPGVVAAAVEVADALRGSKIVAVVTEGVDQRAVLAEIGGELPKLALPRQFVVVPELPKMPSGKIDYRGLVNLVRELVQKGNGQ